MSRRKKVAPEEPEVIRRVMKEETARQMRKALATVCTEWGTGRRAMVKGHQVAGKTGTALKLKPNGRTQERDRYTTSFVGMLPAEKPEFVCLVVIDGPLTRAVQCYGGTIAAPIFSNIATRVAEAMGIPAEESSDGVEK